MDQQASNPSEMAEQQRRQLLRNVFPSRTEAKMALTHANMVRATVETPGWAVLMQVFGAMAMSHELQAFTDKPETMLFHRETRRAFQMVPRTVQALLEKGRLGAQWVNLDDTDKQDATAMDGSEQIQT